MSDQQNKADIKTVRIVMRSLAGGNFGGMPKPDEMPELEARIRELDGMEALRLVQRLGEDGLIRLKVM